MESNVLSLDNILGILGEQVMEEPALLQVDSGEPPNLRSGLDILAGIVHSAFLAVGFRNVGVHDQPTAASPPTLTRLPPQWNGRDTYAMYYLHSQSQLNYMVKVIEVAGNVVVHATSIEDKKLRSIQVPMDEYIAADASFPPPDVSVATLKKYFRSPEKAESLIRMIKVELIQPLIPGLDKPGYVEEPVQQGPAAGTSTTPRREPPPEEHPSPPPRHPFGLRPEYQRPYNPYEVGRDDLDPLGGRDFDPLGRIMAPQRGGGMIVGPDHPMFDRRRFEGSNQPGVSGPFLPPGAVPPGARFDPIGPFGASPLDLRRGNNGGRYFSGEPNPDHTHPPGPYFGGGGGDFL